MLHTLDLNGTWKVRWSDGQRGRPHYAERETTDPLRYIDAQVPGEVHLDAIRAGWITEPTLGTNCLAARWVEECIWSYRRLFDAPTESLVASARSWLAFDGLDYAAKIVLNGKTVGTHNNFFYPCRLQVTGLLKPKDNILVVHLDSGLHHVGDKPHAGWGSTADEMRLHKRNWLRKPQCSFSWDWATRLINVGIHGAVRLETTAAPARIDQLVPLATLSDDLATGTVCTRLFVDGLTPETQTGELTVEVLETGEIIRQAVAIKPGLAPVEATVKVATPTLWWPVGHGPQDRYSLRVTLSINGTVIGEKTARIGFRHIRVQQDPHPISGNYFIIHVNNRRIFAKGANLVPADMIFARIDAARSQALVERALEANFNFLRVWGGGLYESDAFYDCCDEKGILVWQEFIYACGKYPMTDKAFFDDAKREAVYQIRRLANHPSLIVWCGNNEMEAGNWEWGYDNGVVYPDYAFFHLTLPQLLAAEDPTRYYQPSSPISPDGTSPTADDRGDQHPWSIGMFNLDFREYRRMICRFPNEGGFLGPTALPTMLAALPEGQQYVQSFAWQIHDNSVDSWADPSPTDTATQVWLGKDIRKMSIEEYTYWGGLLQGEALREYIENFHRRMYDSSAAIFWMFNDCWPATRSWTIVDYYLRRTPSFHPVRRAMASVNVVVVEEANEILIFGVNETQSAVRAELRYGLFELTGGYPLDMKKSVRLAPNASSVIAKFPKARWKDPATTIAFATLTQDSTLLARTRLILPLYKDLSWPKAKPKISIKRSAGHVTFQSPTFAWGICLDLDGDHALPDNFFDLYPGQPYTLPWTQKGAPKILHLGNLG